MRYLLAALSHGDPESSTQHETIESFREHVTPKPVAGVAVHDGHGFPYIPMDLLRPERQDERMVRPWLAQAGGEQRGFCAATRDLWRMATATADEYGCAFIFWLEHDFVFTEPIDLIDMAEILFRNPRLAQLALMRDAVSPHEKRHGGLYESRRGEFTPVLNMDDLEGMRPPVWLEHRSYFTTNPHLAATEFMRAHPWPSYQEQCEGRHGLDLVRAGYRFGVLGDGRPMVRHIGTRTGVGY